MRQKNKTRAALLDAFQSLIFSQKLEDISVTQVVELADVGRSTFYQHFDNLDDLLLTSIEPLFDALSTCLNAQSPTDDFQQIVDHIWDNRRMGQFWRNPSIITNFENKLYAKIRPQLSQPESPAASLVAQQISASLISILKIWVSGRLTMPSDELAKRLCLSAQALASTHQP